MSKKIAKGKPARGPSTASAAGAIEIARGEYKERTARLFENTLQASAIASLGVFRCEASNEPLDKEQMESALRTIVDILGRIDDDVDALQTFAIVSDASRSTPTNARGNNA